MATMPPALICSGARSGSRLARPAFSSSPHTLWNFSGSKKIGSQPSASCAVAVTLRPIRLAHQMGISWRTGWLISFSDLPRPVPCPSGSGTCTVCPLYSNFSRRQIIRQLSMYSLMRTIGFSYGTPWKPSITCGPLAPRPRMNRPLET